MKDELLKENNTHTNTPSCVCKIDQETPMESQTLNMKDHPIGRLNDA